MVDKLSTINTVLNMKLKRNYDMESLVAMIESLFSQLEVMGSSVDNSM